MARHLKQLGSAGARPRPFFESATARRSHAGGCAMAAALHPSALKFPRTLQEAVMRHLPIVSLVAMTITLAACGGAGSEVASIPPALPTPPPPPPSIVSTTVDTTVIPSPATRPGTFDTIALVVRAGAEGISTYRLASPSEVRITAYQPGPSPNEISYTLQLNAPELPGETSSLTSIIKPIFASRVNRDVRFGDIMTASNTYSDGTKNEIDRVEHRSTVPYRGEGNDNDGTVSISSGREIRHLLYYDVGLSYVSLGLWQWAGLLPDGNGFDEGAFLFVHGERTLATDIPTSGTASYSAATLNSIFDITLSANFGQRTLSAQLARAAQLFYDGDRGYTTILGVDVHGTGAITASGSFSIPLSGTLINPELAPREPTLRPATGLFEGAFFGPNAAQVGGFFAIGLAPGGAEVLDAFVGARD